MPTFGIEFADVLDTLYHTPYDIRLRPKNHTDQLVHCLASSLNFMPSLLFIDKGFIFLKIDKLYVPVTE